jgi:hypothetical protein
MQANNPEGPPVKRSPGSVGTDRATKSNAAGNQALAKDTRLPRGVATPQKEGA